MGIKRYRQWKHLKIEAVELWCYRRLLRVSWTEKKSNDWVLNKMDVSEGLLTTIGRSKMVFVGHIPNGKDITSDLLLRYFYSTRERGRPSVRYSDKKYDSVIQNCTE